MLKISKKTFLPEIDLNLTYKIFSKTFSMLFFQVPVRICLLPSACSMFPETLGKSNWLFANSTEFKSLSHCGEVHCHALWVRYEYIHGQHMHICTYVDLYFVILFLKYTYCFIHVCACMRRCKYVIPRLS